MGRPRSGTTLLRTILDCHDKIVVPTEYPILLRVLSAYKQRFFFSEKQKHTLFRQFISLKKHEQKLFETLRLDEDKLCNSIMKHRGPLTLQQALLYFILSCSSARLNGQPLLCGDKNPVYAFFIKTFMKRFPEAKFVFIIRDPRDQFLSMKKFHFEAANPFLQGIRWKMIYKSMLQALIKFPERTFLVHYEQLVNHPKETIMDVCQFLGVDFQTEMLNFGLYVSENVSSKDLQFVKYFHDAVFTPVNTSATGKWVEQLSRFEISAIEIGVGHIKSNEYKFLTNHKKSISLMFSYGIWRFYAFAIQTYMYAIFFIPPALRNGFILTLKQLSKNYYRIKNKFVR